MGKYLSVSEMAKFCGVCIKTLHSREITGALMPSYRTPGGRRRYDRESAKRFCGIQDNPTNKTTILYSRVSSADQKHDLIEIITVFSAKLYGRRSSQNRIKVGATLKNI